MQIEYCCPICGSNDWKYIQAFRYLKDNHNRSSRNPFSRLSSQLSPFLHIVMHARPRYFEKTFSVLNDYELLRRNILFDIWNVGKRDLTIKVKVCLNCTFVGYSPRPNSYEVDAGFRYLLKHEGGVGGQHGYSNYARYLDTKRALRIYNCIGVLGIKQKLRVLDFGGGNGKLLTPFLNQGHNCYIIDYSTETIPGIVRLGDSIDGIEREREFDAIICSHVLEHIVDPISTILELKRHLAEHGILYAEVPQEIWGGIRLGREPVTHINFFTKYCFRNLFQRCGFKILSCQTDVGNIGKFTMEAICSIATRGEDNDSMENLNSSEEIKGLLYPSRLKTLKRISVIRLIVRMRWFLGYLAGKMRI